MGGGRHLFLLTASMNCIVNMRAGSFVFLLFGFFCLFSERGHQLAGKLRQHDQ